MARVLLHFLLAVALIFGGPLPVLSASGAMSVDAAQTDTAAPRFADSQQQDADGHDCCTPEPSDSHSGCCGGADCQCVCVAGNALPSPTAIPAALPHGVLATRFSTDLPPQPSITPPLRPPARA